MSANHVIDRMNVCFHQLEQGLIEIDAVLKSLTPLQANVFQLPDIEKGKEHDEVTHISVIPCSGEAAFDAGLQHFRRLFIHHHAQHISSKAAVRLPGVLCYSATYSQVKSTSALISEVNQLKKQLEKIIAVESGLPPEQRFEFVHAHLKGLITLSAYRSLTVLHNPTTVRFGWANKSVIKNMQRDEVIARLEKSLTANRSVPPYSREQWAELVSQELEDVMRLPEGAKLKIKRPVKVQPIARVWYQEEQKQVQHPCSMPLISLTDEFSETPVPLLGDLGDYDADNIQVKHRPRAKKLELLIPRLHLYRELD
ncbi:DNA replication terminus site-binding protein [Hafnia paralvei]|jgi:DNA replication terminus site-binding protein|uniref:DNA replication terminus site-binding protein n=1 Tax=Hafnia paralvei TaxID=546367 RepID=UPI001033D1C0|nr:DNA replication terminus site-binding protein [Hafnia paralvei]MCE9881914.1 DNA replication terminus site-binding protein [Hafnia paralvei]MCE9908400.1 DNA replication terminus site-binding protein [Hafnia paralvei]MCE9911329.1 DNA replication terminus site-binding protein [Hafnia paralvei]NIH31106.1 DNA replication terminus site-binding protein [Hafnia paralvei]NUN40401.1 DNA replication terminus site-binding protein [Hafnia paralvei]